MKSTDSLELCLQDNPSSSSEFHDEFNPFPKVAQKKVRPAIEEKVADYFSSEWIDEVVADRKNELRSYDILEEIQVHREKISKLLAELGQINLKALSSSLFGNKRGPNDNRKIAIFKNNIHWWNEGQFLNALEKVSSGLPSDSEIHKIIEEELTNRLTNNFKYLGFDIKITTREDLSAIENKRFVLKEHKVATICNAHGHGVADLVCDPSTISSENKCFFMPVDHFVGYVECSGHFEEWRENRDKLEKLKKEKMVDQDKE